ncbi:MAG TPA: Rieske 2Fe-2S domain-containing protein [Candidatus Limnocylindrales bacterium]|nr:Rieske 2Fe-2S domain-containing protein [Candidatus Limnocylindrales bacterium]
MRRIDLLGLDEVPEGTLKMAWVDGADQVVVVHSNGVIRAFQGICTHEYFELDKGFLTGGGSPGSDGRESGTLTCALHLSRFDLGTGEALDPPAELPLAVYEVVIEAGRILIDVPDGPLLVNE